MKQQTHTWIALRALALIKKDPKTRGLAKLLEHQARESYIGCWLPDMISFKKGHGQTEKHTFKMEPYKGDVAKRFVVEKNNLLRKLNRNLELHTFLSNDTTLNKTWWKGSYKADNSGGNHLPDVMDSLFDTILDLMLLGDKEVDKIVPGAINFTEYLTENIIIRKEQISTFYFMLSHYIADCFMPCHCDKRVLGSYKNGKVHKQWEMHLDNKIGSYFSKKNLIKSTAGTDQILMAAEGIDNIFGLSFPSKISFSKKHDVWESAIFFCRASFAFSNILFSKQDYSFTSKKSPKFGEYFSDKTLLKEYDKIILQSAVYSVASIWKKAWRKFKD